MMQFDLKQVRNVLQEAEDVLNRNDIPEEMYSDPFHVCEPTPIGPRGVRHVVPDLAPWETHLQVDCNMTGFLISVLRSHDGKYPAVSVETKRRQRASWTAGQEQLLLVPPTSSHCSRPMQRASWSIGGQNNYGDRLLPSSVLSLDEDARQDCGDDRFRSYQAEQWRDRFYDLRKFEKQHGHCLVPHNFDENPALAQWVKRQRYQYKLRNEGKHTTLTSERQAKLEAMGFVWDSHKAAWEEKYSALCFFFQLNGHANVPTKYEDRALAIWVKCQRRQYKLYVKGERSAMCPERIGKLEGLGFIWNPRRLGKSTASGRDPK